MRISSGIVSSISCALFLLFFLGQAMILPADERTDILEDLRELVKNGQAEHAMPVLNRRLQSNPDDTDFLLLRSSARLQMVQMTAALADARKAVASSNNHVEAHCHLAAILLSNKQYDEAAPLLQRAIEIDPSFFLARMNMAYCYKAQRKPLNALYELDAALKINPGSPDALLFRARLKKENGDRAGAEADFILAARAVPEGLDQSIQEEIATIRSERARLGDGKVMVSENTGAEQSEASQNKVVKRPGTDKDSLLQFSQTAIAFRNFARFDYFAALAQYASADVQRMFAKYDGQIWPTAYPEDGWAYFFDGSIICLGTLNRTKELVVAYYHPWSEVFLITVWKQNSRQKPQIVDAEVLMADFLIKAGKPPFAASRFWLREANQFRPFMAGISAARSLRAFESAFRKDAAGRTSWRNAIPALAKTAAADAVREKNRYGAGLMLAMNLKEILDASVVEPQGAIATAYKNTWASFQKSLKNGEANTAAQNSPATLPETKQVLSQLNDDDWRQFRLVSYIPTESACLAMMSRADTPDQYLSILFKPQEGKAALDRVDLMSFQAMHELLASQEANQ